MTERLLQWLDAASRARVAVLGDYMVDQYLYGDADRISPEAPVPILRIVKRDSGLGGAASVAANITALGGQACCVGIVGADDPGRHLCDSLAAHGANVEGLMALRSRPTTVKTRL